MGPTPIAPTPEDELRRAMAARGLMAPQAGAQPASQPTIGAPASAPAVPARGLTPPTAAPQDPALQANVSRLNTLQSSPSGIVGIHNPVLRTGLQVGDALLSSFLPGLAQGIPGTQLHHNELVREARGNVAQGNRQQQAQATLGKTAADTAESQARVPLTQAQTDEATANTAKSQGEESRAAAGAQGATDYRTAQTREVNAHAKNLENPPGKEEEAGKTITTDQGVMQWNPETKRYDIKAGKAPEKADKQQGTVHQLDDGSLIVAHPDGSATAVTVNGKAVKGPPKEPKEPPDHGQNFVDPATGNMVRVNPGGAVPKGAVTAGGFNSENVNADKHTAAEAKARAQAGKDLALVQQFVDKPSPAGDVAIVMHFMGAIKPDSLGKMRFNKNEQDYIEGTRSKFGDLEALLTRTVNGQKLPPQQRQDMLKTMQVIAGPQGGGGDQRVKAYADQYFGGDVGKAQAAIDQQRKGK